MGSFVLHGNIIDSESPERLRVAADSYLVCEEGRCTGVFRRCRSDFPACR